MTGPKWACLDWAWIDTKDKGRSKKYGLQFTLNKAVEKYLGCFYQRLEVFVGMFS